MKRCYYSIFDENDYPSNDNVIKVLEQEIEFNDNKNEGGYWRIRQYRNLFIVKLKTPLGLDFNRTFLVEKWH